MKGILVLADGTVIEGNGLGICSEVVGEVVFNTSMVGYTEALTDPSYKGQILMFTYPLIGNYAIPPDFESDAIQPEGFIVREACRRPHHWQSDKTILQWAEDKGVPGIEGVDTRMLTRKIREHGVINGVLKVYDGGRPDIENLVEKAGAFNIEAMDLVSKVSLQSPEEFMVGGKHTVVLVDCGVKGGIIRDLNERGINVIAVPPSSKAEDVMSYSPAGVVIPNGPGNPESVPYVQDLVKDLLGKVPMFGICLGHQAIALACGARIYKLKFGHRGSNQPVKDLETGTVHITSQNHGYVVDADSLEGTGLVVNRVNMNDGTVEGVVHEKLNVFSVQYHPEAAPGPHDSKYLFDRFLETMGVSM